MVSTIAPISQKHSAPIWRMFKSSVSTKHPPVKHFKPPILTSGFEPKGTKVGASLKDTPLLMSLRKLPALSPSQKGLRRGHAKYIDSSLCRFSWHPVAPKPNMDYLAWTTDDLAWMRRPAVQQPGRRMVRPFGRQTDGSVESRNQQ